MKGHIRERSPGRWAIVLDHHDPITGRRKRRWHSSKGTKREAQIECAKLIAEQQSGGAIDPDKVTVAQFLDRFETDWIANHVSPHSRERYGYVLNHVRQHLGARPLQKLRPADLAAFYATLAREGLAPRTIRLIHTVLHRALGQAKIWGVIRDNPADLAKPPKMQIRKLRCCSRIRLPPYLNVFAATPCTSSYRSPWARACGGVRCLDYAGRMSISMLGG
jgi:hypothetical protein